MEFFTLNSSFTDGKATLTTNSTDFLKQAISIRYITKLNDFNMVHDETGYTSSKSYPQF